MIKKELLEITYSYWDGSGHRRKIEVMKGDTVGTFLRKIREQLAPSFRELRTAEVANMMYIKVQSPGQSLRGVPCMYVCVSLRV
jgi:protein FAM50